MRIPLNKQIQNFFLKNYYISHKDVNSKIICNNADLVYMKQKIVNI